MRPSLDGTVATIRPSTSYDGRSTTDGAVEGEDRKDNGAGPPGKGGPPSRHPRLPFAVAGCCRRRVAGAALAGRNKLPPRAVDFDDEGCRTSGVVFWWSLRWALPRSRTSSTSPSTSSFAPSSDPEENRFHTSTCHQRTTNASRTKVGSALYATTTTLFQRKDRNPLNARSAIRGLSAPKLNRGAAARAAGNGEDFLSNGTSPPMSTTRQQQQHP